MKLSKIDTPQSFFDSIPTGLEENLSFRDELHKLLIKDTGFQNVFLNMCFANLEIAFNSMLWTYDPRRKPGEMNLPFILRPKQVEAVHCIRDAIDNDHNLIIDKSRDEGATELISGVFALYFILIPQVYFLVGSRAEEFVDDSDIQIRDNKIYGPHVPIFHKILYKIVNLPLWLKSQFVVDKKFKFMQNLTTGASIKGQATGPSFSASDRAKAVFVDEFARIEPKLASSIVNSIHDVSNCCIINSTHWVWGAGHPYAKILRSNKWPVFTLDWSDNPVKAKGLYRSPDLDVIEIIDIDYYRNLCPEIFDRIEPNKPFKLSELENECLTLSAETQDKLKRIKFIADGGTKNYKKPRSPWFDREEAKRTDPRDIAQNILRVPEASADQVFNPETLEIIRTLHIKKPDYQGEITYHSERIDKELTIDDIKFEQAGDKSSFKWWGKLIKGRPFQGHNYIVACDIGRGTGASNSTSFIFDVNTNEQVGEYANAYTDVSDFAEQIIAICKWVGGASKLPYLIWEANGVGDTFESRIRNYGYFKVYTRTDERSKIRKKRKQFGWWSTAGVNGTRLLLFSQLDASLSESVKEDKKYFYVIIRSESLLNELMDFMFTPNRMDAGISSSIDESTGAKFAHGDRVIPAGLVGLAVKEQPRAIVEEVKECKPGTFGYRFQEWRKQNDEENRHKRTFRF